MNQRLERIALLAPILQEPARQFIAAAKKDLGHTLCVTHTWRSALDQLQLYSQGRQFSRSEGIWTVTHQYLVVTNAEPGKSAHNIVKLADQTSASLALDLIPINPDGTLAWKTPVAVWAKIWMLAWKFGLDPLGDTVGSYLDGDNGHFQEPGWKLKMAAIGLGYPVINVNERI